VLRRDLPAGIRPSRDSGRAAWNRGITVGDDDLDATVHLAAAVVGIARHRKSFAKTYGPHALRIYAAPDDSYGHRIRPTLGKLEVEIVGALTVGECFHLHAAFRVLVEKRRYLID
jgi:hypothetical protein